MALQHLTEEQIRDWSREQKDRWWLEKVYRGNMPQLTIRSAIIGFLLGGVLSATNLYVGARTGWTLGVGLTSVILAFVAFRLFARIGAKDLTILENNCSQSIATAAGYMTGPLVSGFAAYMWVQNEKLPFWQMFWFNVVLSFLGVLVAFPMKRKFINDEQQPFPEGRACGVVLDTLYTSSAAVGMFKAKALGVAAGLAGFISIISGESLMKVFRAIPLWIQEGGGWFELVKAKRAVLDKMWHLPHNLDAWYYWMVDKKWVPVPRLAGVDIRQLSLSPALDFAMIGAGGLMGIRAASSMMIGMLVNFVIIVPWMISIEEIRPQTDIATGAIKYYAENEPLYGRAWVLNSWALWWGIIIMVVASMVSLFAKPKVFVEAFRTVFDRSKAEQGKDVLKHIELPLWISWVGIPIFGAIGVWMAHAWFGVDWFLGALSIPLIIVLTLIAASSTALTGITPTGSLSKIPQFIFGAAAPKHPATNLMTAIMTTEVTSNASNLLMDIKPGYMLGGKPRHQAIGHCIGVFSGALAATPLFYLLFMSGAKEGQTIQETMLTSAGDQFTFPGAMQWKGVSDLITSIFGGSEKQSLLTDSIVTSMIIAGIVGVVFELARVFSKGKFPISPLAIGLGVVVPPESTFAMFLGAGFFWLMHKRYHKKPEATGHKLWIDTHEPICAGLIAGAALVGIADILAKVFLLK